MAKKLSVKKRCQAKCRKYKYKASKKACMRTCRRSKARPHGWNRL